jgi:hypothetical protein
MRPDIRECLKAFRCEELTIKYGKKNQTKETPKTSGELVFMNG